MPSARPPKFPIPNADDLSTHIKALNISDTALGKLQVTSSRNPGSWISSLASKVTFGRSHGHQDDTLTQGSPTKPAQDAPPAFPVPQAPGGVAPLQQPGVYAPPPGPPPGNPDQSYYDPNALPRPPVMIAVPMPQPGYPAPYGFSGSSSSSGFLGPPQHPVFASSSTSDLLPLPGSFSGSSTPAKGAKASNHRRAHSVPPDSSATDNNGGQCCGVTKTGNRCTRIVKSTSGASDYVDPNDPIERFCHQHRKEVLSPTGFHGRRTNAWVNYGDYIPDYLQEDTKVALRVEMEKAPSPSDVDGYIYCFQIMNDKTPNHVHLKVGRSTNLNKRLGQWGKQCDTHELSLRGYWPEQPSDQSLLPGKVQAGRKAPYSKRLERLIHLELADISIHEQYLQKGFPDKMDASGSAALQVPGGSAGATGATGSAPSTPNKKAAARAKAADERMSGKTCPDCGSVHREIFTFAKAKGKYKDKEWEKLVWEVMKKWGTFVETQL